MHPGICKDSTGQAERAESREESPRSSAADAGAGGKALVQPAMTGPITMSANTMNSRIKPSFASSDM
jgi:hypothetical protein